MEKVIMVFKKFGKVGIISAFLIVVFVVGNSTGPTSKVQVLSASTHVTPTSTLVPVPTSVPVTVINTIIIPTSTPIVVTQMVTPTPVELMPTPTVAQPTPTPILSVQPTEEILSPTPGTMQSPASPTPTPTVQNITIEINYAGQHATSSYVAGITAGETAWQAVLSAVGLSNLHYADYGGSLGIFITGFNGVDALSNQYYDFQVNGTSSNTGVSSYIVADHDVLRFVLTGF